MTLRGQVDLSYLDKPSLSGITHPHLWAPPGPLAHDDTPFAFLCLSRPQQTALLYWIHCSLRPARDFSWDSSYVLKARAEREVMGYITNGSMKGAMLIAGWAPKDPREQNWRFRIRFVHGMFASFCAWSGRTYDGLGPDDPSSGCPASMERQFRSEQSMKREGRNDA